MLRTQTIAPSMGTNDIRPDHCDLDEKFIKKSSIVSLIVTLAKILIVDYFVLKRRPTMSNVIWIF